MNGKQAYIKEVFISYCLTLFSIFYGLNLSTVSSFGWLPRGGETLQCLILHGFGFFMTLDFWYLMAGAIYMAVPIIFLSFFLFGYLNSQVQIGNRRAMFFELTYLTLAGAVPVPTLHLARVILTFLPIVDPVLELQLTYLKDVLCVQPQDWKPRAFPISQEALVTGYYSVIVVAVFLVLFLTFDILSRKRLFLFNAKRIIGKIIALFKNPKR